MTETLSRQALEFLAAGGLGMLLGLLYDLGRGLRREKPGLTVLMDILFALVFFLGLWLMSIYTWGLRLYQVLGAALGGSLYFLTVSPVMLGLFRKLFRGMGRIWAFALSPAKKSVTFLKKLLKKLFPSVRKWGTIGIIPFSRKESREVLKNGETSYLRKSSAGRAAGPVRRRGHVPYCRGPDGRKPAGRDPAPELPEPGG